MNEHETKQSIEYLVNKVNKLTDKMKDSENFDFNSIYPDCSALSIATQKAIIDDIMLIVGDEFQTYERYCNYVKTFNDFVTYKNNLEFEKFNGKDIQTINILAYKVKLNEDMFEYIRQKNNIKYYVFYVRKYSFIENKTVLIKYIAHAHRYMWTGRYYSNSLEKVECIDYMEISKEKYNELLKDNSYLRG